MSKCMKQGLGEGGPSPAPRPGVDEYNKRGLWQVWHHKLFGITQVRKWHPALCKPKWHNVCGWHLRTVIQRVLLTCKVPASLLQSYKLCIQPGQLEAPQAVHSTMQRKVSC